MKKIFVGNLPWDVDDQKLEDMFTQYGDVQSSKVITDRETGRSRGFGFIEMDEDAANDAISGLNGKDVGGRDLRVNEANERPERSGGYRGGGSSSRGGGYGGGRDRY